MGQIAQPSVPDNHSKLDKNPMHLDNSPAVPAWEFSSLRVWENKISKLLVWAVELQEDNVVLRAVWSCSLNQSVIEIDLGGETLVLVPINRSEGGI